MNNLKKIRLNKTHINVSTSYWEDLPETGTHNFQKTISLEQDSTQAVVTMDVTTDIGSLFVFGEDVYSLPPSASSKIDYTVSIPGYFPEKSVVHYFNLDGENEVESDFLNSEGCHIKIGAYCKHVASYATVEYRITFSLVYNVNTYHGVIFNETISKQTVVAGNYHDFGSKEYSSSTHEIVYMR